MTSLEQLRRQVSPRKARIELARRHLFDFIRHIFPKYVANWHHALICAELETFLDSDTENRLMLFVPPQHGKSEISSRCLPAYVLGRNPDTKIAGCSYSIDLARSFNREIQRYIESPEFKEVFPAVRLNDRSVVADALGAYLRNTEEFEVVGYKGAYKSVGVMGGLSGRTVDLAIVDDPVKDAIEANSATYRDRVWDWYVNVLETRLHNESKVILIMTRWHEDDLAGRLLKRQPERWRVIKIPAIKEAGGHPADPREEGAPLWPERHSLEKLLNIKALSERTFGSLYQQNPTPTGGDKIKADWFEYCDLKEVPDQLTREMWIDGAYTKSTANDPTGLMVTAFDVKTNRLYILHAKDAYMEMPQLLAFLSEYADLHGLRHRSRLYFEPKASGKSLRQMVSHGTKLSAVEIKNPLVQEGKEARIQTAAPKVEAGKVILVRGTWNDRFVYQLTGFPAVPHDEYVDLLGYACYHYFDVPRSGGIRRRN